MGLLVRLEKIYLCLNINELSHFRLDLVNDYSIILDEENNFFFVRPKKIPIFGKREKS